MLPPNRSSDPTAKLLEQIRGPRMGREMEWIPLEDLIAAGADVNASSRHGVTPLMYACSGNLELVQLLLDHGADVSARDHFGGTCLMAAANGGHIAIVRLLLDHGAAATINADVGVVGGGSPRRRTALYMAQDKMRSFLRVRVPPEAERYAGIVKMLEDAGAKE